MSYFTDVLPRGYAGDVSVMRLLQLAAHLNNEQAAKALLVAPATYERWLRDRKPNPTAVRLLAVLAGYMPWSPWTDWEMSGGYLFPPGYVRNGILPAHILTLPFLRAALEQLQVERARSRRDVPPQVVRRPPGVDAGCSASYTAPLSIIWHESSCSPHSSVAHQTPPAITEPASSDTEVSA